MDLIRALLMKLEALPMRPGDIFNIPPDAEQVQVENYTPEQIDYHLMQIAKAGLIDDGGVRPMRGIGFRSLTWFGHDLVDSIRDPEIWSQTKQAATEAGGFTAELLHELAKGLIKNRIEDRMGIKL